MTALDVDRACLALEAEGVTPSGNSVLRHLQQRGVPASKRTVLKYLRLRRLAEAGGPATGFSTAQDAPEYGAPQGPVEAAERALRLAEVHLGDARDALVQAKTVLLATQPLPIQGILRGQLQPSDDFPAQALEDVDLCKRDYDAAWAQREAARQELERLHRLHREADQKAWVAQMRPQLVETLAHWQEKLRTATSDRMHAQAKKEFQSAMYQYQQAVAQAPYTHNGTTP